MKRIDMRSLVLGAALGAATFFVLGAGREGLPPANISTGYYGRFQGFASGTVGFVVDTETGKTYSTVNDADLFYAQKVNLSTTGFAPPNRQ